MEQTFFPVTQREAKRSGIQYSSEANKNARFPSQLRELRMEKGISQETLSKVLGVSKSTIGLWENGDTLPDAKAIHDLAAYFEVSTEYILCRTRVKTNDTNLKNACEYTGLNQEAIEQLHQLAINSDGINAVLSFINVLLSSKDLRHFKKAAFYEAALRISSNKSGDVIHLSELNDDDIADRLRLVRLEEQQREERILSDLKSVEQTEKFIQVSTQEASILYNRIALAALEGIYDDSIFEIEKAYRN